MTNFTKGPWRVEVGSDSRHCCFGWSILSSHRDGYGEYVDVCEVLEGTECDAQLIAAAPEMYEALKNIENDDNHMPDSAWRMIQDAIAKAEIKE